MALFSGRANLMTSENFEAATQAAVSAESVVNEALVSPFASRTRGRCRSCLT